jgi:organic radical activating enzyme
MLAIEIIEGCNFKCYFCPAKDLDKNLFMDLELFKRIVLEAKELGITKLNLTPCKGEPFMHPNIYEMLEFVNTHMEEALLFTNATTINITKLKQININKITLCVSFYGETVDKFVELTQAGKNLFNIFHKRLIELKEANIKHEIHRRDQNYQFDYTGNNIVHNDILDVKCKYHQEPKIFANGDVTFCIFAREEVPNSKKIFYANVNSMSLKEILEDPIRYKFYESQSICANHCSSFNRNCYTGYTITSLKLINISKKNYISSKEDTDIRYAEIEKELL